MPDKDYATKFKQWFADMQERHQQYYGGYEDLFQEAFEAGAKHDREKWNEEIYQLGYKTGFREGKQHESKSSF